LYSPGCWLKQLIKGYIGGFMNDLYPEGVISLQYADGTLLFLGHNNKSAVHLKWLLIYFKKLSDMRINYHKSDLTPINLDDEETQDYAKTFYCNIGKLPSIYLGVPLHYESLRREDIQHVVDKIMKRILGWKGKLLS
jgi:hypothetical protein